MIKLLPTALASTLLLGGCAAKTAVLMRMPPGQYAGVFYTDPVCDAYVLMDREQNVIWVVDTNMMLSSVGDWPCGPIHLRGGKEEITLAPEGCGQRELAAGISATETIRHGVIRRQNSEYRVAVSTQLLAGGPGGQSMACAVDYTGMLRPK